MSIVAVQQVVVSSRPSRATKERELPTSNSASSAAGPLADAEDHELGGLDGRHADFADQTAQVALLNRVRLGVALDKERLGGAQAKQSAAAPDRGEEGADIAIDRDHRNGSLGSNTTHCVPRSMDFST